MYPTSLRARSRLSDTVRNLSLWTLQGWLTMFFAGAGYAKLTEPLDILVHLLTWPAGVPLALIRTVGLVEIGLAMLLLAPALSRKGGSRPCSWQQGFCWPWRRRCSGSI